MSLSPRNENDPDQIFQYRKAWAAINTMLERGRSLSGHERHCAFLNTGGQRFADISAASGLDLLDDGRGVALVDWDCDGRVDLWTTNRTGPWVRLLLNRSDIGHHFVSVKLEGVRANRDAIGARLELHLGGDSPRTLYKSLRAGEGFIAQSSKRILFGLGDESKIEKLVVRWPGGDVQSVAGLKADRHYQIMQGESKPKHWNPPRSVELPEAAPPKHSDAPARIALAGRVPLPELKYQQFSGEVVELTEDLRRPTLINLWASWCAPCMTELKDWKDHWPELSKHVEILALNVDGLDTASGASALEVEGIVRERHLPFATAVATRDSVDVLEIAVNALVDKPQPLVVPMSVLVDARGGVAVIYRGAAGAAQLLDDVKSLDSAPRQRRDRAAHFAGRWFDEPTPSDPTVLLRSFVVAGRLEAAEDYLQRWMRAAGDNGRPTVEAYYVVADAHRAAGQLNDAASLYEKALEVDPNQPRVNLDLAICLMNLRRFDQAIPHFERSLQREPNNADTRKRLVLALSRADRFEDMQSHARVLVQMNAHDAIARLHLAHALKKQQQYADALVHYQTVISQQPNLLIAQNDLAWFLATCPDDKVRDGETAVAYAEQACRATNYSHAAILDTLAAAQAEMRRYDEAARTLERAQSMAAAAGDQDLTRVIERHLTLYRNAMPLREE